ncbi:glycosyltransferase family 2 protein [Leuconostoc pseudomesenteroides]|uniref:glycosyltransferase family 2 protein n=1 Tax=Leuconostoc pseudomesenteroides TaxID=33968 RepID=UPI00301E2989
MIIVSNILQFYTTYYPIIMTLIWILGSWISGNQSHTSDSKYDSLLNASVTILLPTFNEEHTVIDTLKSLVALNYTNYNIIVVDDKSNDFTVSVVKKWLLHNTPEVPIKLLELPNNMGKAQALNEAMSYVESEYVLVTDADALMNPNALHQMLKKFDRDNVGAVTGKPVVRNRTTILGRLQTLEYVGIIDRIKRAQDSLFGGIMTVAGVIALYRSEALSDVGGFDKTAVTEDIDMTWRLRRKKWLIHYTPLALTYILVPETFSGYFKQRIRWSVGGLEVFLKNAKLVYHNEDVKQKFLLFDMLFSHIWAWLALITFFQYIIVTIGTQTFSLPGVIILIYIALFSIMICQGIIQDKRHSQLSLHDVFEIPFYSTFYWTTALITAIASQIIVCTLHRRKGSWTSPDRGK